MNRTLQCALLGSLKVLKIQIQLLEDLVTSACNDLPSFVSPEKSVHDENEIIDNRLSKIFKEDE
jgi:hypothetical protein